MHAADICVCDDASPGVLTGNGLNNDANDDDDDDDEDDGDDEREEDDVEGAGGEHDARELLC